MLQYRLFRNAAALVCALALPACATKQLALEQHLEPVEPGQRFLLEHYAEIPVFNAEAVKLKPGTVWLKVGRIGQGAVYQTKDQLVVVAGFNSHEADLVVSDGLGVGFYLPLEHSFVESEPTPVSLTKVRD